MSRAAADNPPAQPPSAMSVAAAIRLAWACWLVLLVLPFFVFLYVLWTLGNSEAPTHSPQGEYWFKAAMLYLLLVVPASFFWRGRVFKAYWSGQPVSPANYLSGMLAVWIALALGGILSLLGCLADKHLLPSLLPALVAFMFFVTLWPSGRAMVGTVGDQHDPAVYEEPR